MTKILLSLTFIIISNIMIAQDFFAKSESFFAQNVSNGAVDYDAILDNPDDMDDLVKIIANADIAETTLLPKLSKALCLKVF